MSRHTRSTANLPDSQGPLFDVFTAIEEQATRDAISAGNAVSSDNAVSTGDAISANDAVVSARDAISAGNTISSDNAISVELQRPRFNRNKLRSLPNLKSGDESTQLSVADKLQGFAGGLKKARDAIQWRKLARVHLLAYARQMRLKI